MKGNMLASLMATFVGNPLTFVFIALASLKTGHLILGTELEEGELSAFEPQVRRCGQRSMAQLCRDLHRCPDGLVGLAIFSRDVFIPI